MRYRITREVGVFVPRRSRLWLPTDYAGWIRAPEDQLYDVLHELAPFNDRTEAANRAIVAHGNEFFIAHSRLWYRTAWTNSPITAALYDLERDNLIRAFWISMDEFADELRLVTRREKNSDHDIAVPEESYAADTKQSEAIFSGGLFKDDVFLTRVLLPYLAARRTLINSLAFRPDTSRANEIGSAIPTDQLKRIICSGCMLPCSAALRLPSDVAQSDDVSMVTVNLGDDYLFGRQTSAALANTSLLFLAAAKGFFDDLDLTLSDPLESINNFAIAPSDHKAPLRDGRELAATDIIQQIMLRISEYLKVAPPGNPELISILNAALLSIRWLPGISDD